jgi:hypothetical protein
MDQNDPHFDDPALREALRRALGQETAPPALRQRIVAALAAERRYVPAKFRRVAYGLAAVLVIGFGLVYAFIFYHREQPAPQWFATAMVAAHDQWSGLPEQHLPQDLNSDNTVSLKQGLRQKLGFPVMVALPPGGWKFVGAGTCSIGSYPAAHLMFVRGDQTISVYSVAARALYKGSESDGTTYAQTEQGHQIAGFQAQNSIHCIVGNSKSGDLSLGDIIRLRDQLRTTLN